MSKDCPECGRTMEWKGSFTKDKQTVHVWVCQCKEKKHDKS